MCAKPHFRIGFLLTVQVQLSLVHAASAAEPAPTFVGHWPPHGQGEAMGVAVEGTIAYVANEFAGLQIIDVSDPTQPHWLAGYDTKGVALNVAVAGGIAYVADGSSGGLQIIDVREPARPKWLGEYHTGGNAYDVAVAGSIAYVADGYGPGLRVIDVTDPTKPRLLATDGTGGAVRAVVVLGDMAYTAGGFGSGLSIFDVSRPAQPKRLGGYSTPGAALDVDVSSERNTAYLAGGTFDKDLGKYVDGLLIVDVSHPAESRRLGGYTTEGECSSVTVVGDIAYVTVRYFGVLLVDVSNPAQPQRLGQIGPSGNVAVAGNTAYIAGGEAGLQIFDVRKPALPTRLGVYDTLVYVFGVATAGDYAYAAGDGLWVIDFRDPTSPRLAGWDDTWRDNQDVKIADGIAYVAASDGGVLTYDVAIPTRPRLLGHYQPEIGEARSIEVHEKTAYLVGTRWDEGRQLRIGALRVIDASNPAELKSIGRSETGGGRYYGVNCAYRVAVSGNVACVADGEAGLGLIDVSDPRQPRQMGSYDTSDSGYAVGIAVASNLCFVADTSTGFQVIDISDPANPRRLWIDETTDGASSVALVGNLAYVSGQSLNVFDIAIPTKPRRISKSAYWSPNGIAAGNGLLFVTANRYGLSAFNLIHEARLDSVENIGGDLRLRVKGTPGVGGQIQRSSDLRNWLDWRSIVLGDSPIELTDAPEEVHQFYRVVLPQ